MSSQAPFPLMPPKSTELRMAHFDENVYTVDDETTLLYQLIAVLCGDGGAGTLKKEIFLQRLSGSLDGIYGPDLDYVFGSVRFLSRVTSESYDHNPLSDELTSDKWDEITTKDAQYRDRIRRFFTACNKGGSVEGIREAVVAATSADCQVMENWRYIDNFGLASGVGRGIGRSWSAVELTTGHTVYFANNSAPNDPVGVAASKAQALAFVTTRPVPANWMVQEVRSRSEVTVVPLKSSLHPREARVMRQMLDRITGQDTVVTVDPNGLSANTPLRVRAITSDSTYFQVEKVVTGSPVLDDLPAPEMLATDLDPSHLWLKSRTPELAPYARFNMTQEHSEYYLVSGGRRSTIDSVSYGTLQDDGTVALEEPFVWYEQSGQFGPWTDYERADSPDNYPGGKYGLTPTRTPALNPDRSPYVWPHASQSDYVAKQRAKVAELGGESNSTRYRLPLQKPSSSRRSYTADLAIAYAAPVRESTITSGWTSRQATMLSTELRNPSIFVKG